MTSFFGWQVFLSSSSSVCIFLDSCTSDLQIDDCKPGARLRVFLWVLWGDLDIRLIRPATSRDRSRWEQRALRAARISDGTKSSNRALLEIGDPQCHSQDSPFVRPPELCFPRASCLSQPRYWRATPSPSACACRLLAPAITMPIAAPIAPTVPRCAHACGPSVRGFRKVASVRSSRRVKFPLPKSSAAQAAGRLRNRV